MSAHSTSMGSRPAIEIRCDTCPGLPAFIRLPVSSEELAYADAERCGWQISDVDRCPECIANGVGGTSRRFVLERDEDVSGVSGTGTVADGVVWPDGTVALRWRGPRASTAVWASIADVEAVHGHDGSTRVVWLDEEPS